MNDCRYEPTVPNNAVPPRPRSPCFAVSPRRGEQAPLGRPSGRAQKYQQKLMLKLTNEMKNEFNTSQSSD